MSDSQTTEQAPSQQGTQADLMSALFAQMVLQQSNLAMMLMGKAPHPESGQTMRDVEGAKLFIDQLEMLEVKTKGNLSKEESNLLKQSLMGLRMAFVDCVSSAPAPAESRAESGATPVGTASATEPAHAKATPGPSGGEEESRKKFTKKY
jgi:hypothetical protein